jgi:CYTH domain-containing protein
MEIERKFLLNDVPPEAVAMPPIVIEQGWIPGTTLRERLRRSTYPDGRVRCTRTIKLGRPEARIEIEEDTGQGIFQAMWTLTSSARIRKRRHVVRDAVHVWEIDVFADRDLVLAEVELDAEDTPVAIPGWLAPYMVREVTGETAYLNSQMARPDIANPDAVGEPSNVA